MHPPHDSQTRRGVHLLERERAFTLMELLVVVGIMCIMMTLAVPAFNALNGAGDLTKGATDIQSFLEEARSQAMAKNTYVYVGFQEVDGITPSPTNGVGEIAMAAVASLDGTRPFGNGVLNTADIGPISKALTVSNVHLTNSASLTRGNMTNRPGQSGYNPPDIPVVDLTVNPSATSFNWPLNTADYHYKFQYVIEFDPQGIPRIQTNSSATETTVQNYFEIPLVVAHGDIVATNNLNEAAIQIDGVTGAVRVYRP